MASNFLDDNDDELASQLENLTIDNMCVITKSQKNKPQLCFNGFHYRISSESKGILLNF